MIEPKLLKAGSMPVAADDYTDLSGFFAPRAVALVGATDDTTRFGGRVLHQMLAFGGTVRVLPVNPSRSKVQGLPCYPSVTELPETPDHVGVIVPGDKVMPVLEESHARGVRFATVFTGGYTETGTAHGREMQEALRKFARATGMRLMGPNCNGFINFVDGFAMTATNAVPATRPPAGNIGVVGQSGGLGQVAVMWRAQQAGLDISYQVSCGNCADLDPLDYARFMIEGDATEVVLLALESIPDGAKFIRTAEIAAEREKPLVIIKFGRSERGIRAAASHTGAMTGADEVFDAAFRQFGLIRVADARELYEMAVALRGKRWPRGRRAAMVTQSGGVVVQMSDSGDDLDFKWADYTEQTQTRIAAIIPGYGKVTNPTDLTSVVSGKMTLFSEALTAITADANVDVVIPVFTMARRAELDHAAALALASPKPVIPLWMGGCRDDPSYDVASMVRSGVAAYRDTQACMKGVQAAMRYREFLAARRPRATATRPPDCDESKARAAIGEAQSKTLTERAAKQVLAAYGLPVTAERMARNAAEAVQYAREIGMPVALKIESPDIPHKTEAGAIRLGLCTDADVHRAFGEVADAARRYRAEATIDGVLVQQMAPPGVELILGLTSNPAFGLVLAAGIGGILVEALHDVAYRIPPVDLDEAHAMLRELRAYAILEGVRGQKRRDIDAIADCIVRLSWLAIDLGDRIAEVDVNPIISFEHGASVVDALLVKR